jgi:hypothetical protein
MVATLYNFVAVFCEKLHILGVKERAFKAGPLS